MDKRKREENLESRDENETGQLIASSFRSLTAEELFHLAAQIEVRFTNGKETSSPSTIFYPYVE